MGTDVSDRLLDVKGLCEWLGVGESTVYHWTAAREIPFVKVGRLMRFERPAIQEWLKARRVNSIDSANL